MLLTRRWVRNTCKRDTPRDERLGAKVAKHTRGEAEAASLSHRLPLCSQERRHTISAADEKRPPPCDRDCSRTSVKHVQIAALVEDAANRLEPNEDTSVGGGFTEDAFVSVSGAVSAIGVELRDRISHALAGRGLDELVEPHRTDMSGLQVRHIACWFKGSI